MNTVTKLHVPLLERLALADLAERQGLTEDQVLARIIRDAVKRECVREAQTVPCSPTAPKGEVGHGG